MPVRVNLPKTLTERLAESDEPLFGLWCCSGSAINAEIVAGSGCDWVLVDAEHSPNGLESILAQLYALSGYPVTPVVRPPFGDTVTLKQFLDLGVQNLLIPMVDTGEQAREIARAVSYPDGSAAGGVRGVGSALARSSRWNRVPNYLTNARSTVSLTVQIESAEAVNNAEEIINTDGVDAVFVGPADLAASLGLIGQPSHPEVVSRVLRVIELANSAKKPVGVNAFAEADARRYLAAGANFVAVGADVAILARQTEQLIAKYREPAAAGAAGAPDGGLGNESVATESGGY